MGYVLVGAVLALVVYGLGDTWLALPLIGGLLGLAFSRLEILKARIAELDRRLQVALTSLAAAREQRPLQSQAPQQAGEPEIRTDAAITPVAENASPSIELVANRASYVAREPAAALPIAALTSTEAELAQAPEAAKPAPVPPPLPNQRIAAPGWAESAPTPEPLWGSQAQPSATRVPSSVPGNEQTPPMPELPGWAKTLLSFENWPIKLGMMLLLIGLASGYRYLAARGYFTIPIEMRLLAVALAAIAALVFGYGKREEKRSFSLSVQGAALGALLLTVYAALQLYHLLNGSTAFALMLAIVAAGVVLAVIQDALWLALFATIGGFAAPILASTGGGSHVQLFSYYLILNLGILAISLKKGWRSLNMLGAICTFGIGLTWGVSYYRPEFFASVEPFLLTFFAIYLAITVLYTLRHGAGEPVLDGILVFGVPMATLGAQAGLLSGQDKKLALSTFCGALIYGALSYSLRPRAQAELLSKCFLVLAVVLFTISIPLYFNAQVTSALWALEGAGVLWLGLRQRRTAPLLLGLFLQLLAWLAYANGFEAMSSTPTLLNAKCLGALILSIASLLCAWLLDRDDCEQQSTKYTPLAWAGVLGGLFWWSLAGLGEIARMQLHPYESAALITWLSASMLLFSVARLALRFDKLALGALFPIALLPLLAIGCYLADGMFAGRRGAAIAAFLLASSMSFFLLAKRALPDLPNTTAAESWPRPALKFVHSIWLIGVCLLCSLALDVKAQHFGEGLRFCCQIAPFALAFLLFLRQIRLVAFPLQEYFDDLVVGWRSALMQLWVIGIFFAFVVGSVLRGDVSPMSYFPVFNPLEITLLGLFAMIWAYSRDEHGELGETAKNMLLAMAFWLLTMATLRAVIVWYEPNLGSLAHAFFNRTGQAALALVWAFAGCGAMLLGHARGRRAVWLAGAALMGVVLVKMFLVDRHNLGELPGIFATLGVGGLLAAVGYFAPVPPGADKAP